MGENQFGSPITLCIKNRDWDNWQEKMSPLDIHRDERIRVTRSRPGHADLAGALKYNQHDVRNILERSSARETAARVAVGSVAKVFLARFGITVWGFVAELGGDKGRSPQPSRSDFTGNGGKVGPLYL